MSKKGYNNYSRRAARNPAPVRRSKPKWTESKSAVLHGKRQEQHDQQSVDPQNAKDDQRRADQQNVDQQSVDPQNAKDDQRRTDQQSVGQQNAKEDQRRADQQSVGQQFEPKVGHAPAIDDSTPAADCACNLEDEIKRRGFQVVRKHYSYQKMDLICFRGRKICIYKGVMERLGYPDYLAFYMNEGTRHFAITSADKPAPDGGNMIYCNTRSMKSGTAVFTDIRLATRIYELMGWSPQMRYVIKGTFIQASDGFMADFDLTDASGIHMRQPLYDATAV